MATVGNPKSLVDSSVVISLDSINKNSYSEYVNGNLVVNGTFEGSSTGWVLGVGWSYGNNNILATDVANGSYLYQNITLVVGKMYKVVVDVIITGGTLTYQLGGSGTDTGLTSGHNVKYYIPTSTGAIYFIPHSTFSGTIDNVSVEEVSTTWTDLSGNGRNGTLVNGPIYDVTDNSLVFDGTDDYVTIPSYTFTNNNSISIWIKPHQLGSGTYNSLFGIKGYTSYIRLKNTIETTSIEGETDTDSDVITLTHNSIPFVADTWYYLVITENASNLWSLYVNGIFMSSCSTTNPNLTITKIGSGYATNSFNGSISNFQIFNRLLSSTEILQNYNALKNRHKFNATGGIITIVNGYKIHTFTATDTFTPNQSGDVEILVVGGGGGGGGGTINGNATGGGGAGGLIYRKVFSVTGSTTATIGIGGVGGSIGDNNGLVGGNSSFGSLVAYGGGYGSCRVGGPGGNGASGGGASNEVSGGTAILSQGNVGGIAKNTPLWRGGGGGGSGVSGSTGADSGNGGIGRAFDISGTLTYYAGGGGGGQYSFNNPGTGGLGGGGNGGGGTPTNGSNGTPNTGGGGGGGGSSFTVGSTGGNGGTGVIIIKYQI